MSSPVRGNNPVRSGSGNEIVNPLSNQPKTKLSKGKEEEINEIDKKVQSAQKNQTPQPKEKDGDCNNYSLRKRKAKEIYPSSSSGTTQSPKKKIKTDVETKKETKDEVEKTTEAGQILLSTKKQETTQPPVNPSMQQVKEAILKKILQNPDAKENADRIGVADSMRIKYLKQIDELLSTIKFSPEKRHFFDNLAVCYEASILKNANNPQFYENHMKVKVVEIANLILQARMNMQNKENMLQRVFNLIQNSLTLNTMRAYLEGENGTLPSSNAINMTMEERIQFTKPISALIEKMKLTKNKQDHYIKLLSVFEYKIYCTSSSNEEYIKQMNIVFEKIVSLIIQLDNESAAPTEDSEKENYRDSCQGIANVVHQIKQKLDNTGQLAQIDWDLLISFMEQLDQMEDEIKKLSKK